MAVKTVGIQLLFTGISAVTAAVVLLWLQTKYRRVKLLRGLQEEVTHNLHTVGEVATNVYKEEDTRLMEQQAFYNEIYRTMMGETPILFSQLVKGLSPLQSAYRKTESLQGVGPTNRIPNESRDELLQELELLEGALLQSWMKIQEVRKEGWFYRLYSRFWLKESLESSPGLWVEIIAKEEIEEVIWRPSGRSSIEQKEANL